HTKIIKCSKDEQSKYKSKLALNKVITGVVILIILIPIMFIYLIRINWKNSRRGTYRKVMCWC
ncbi:hypothetical protein CF088_20510, partial [Clostridium botulinum]|nr:hypothetical protein [Clostridium botulinum]